jgi:hypothetical protein
MELERNWNLIVIYYLNEIGEELEEFNSSSISFGGLGTGVPR